MGDIFLIPFLLSFIAGISTIFGALLYFSVKNINKHSLIFSLGLSAGVMIHISFIELLPLSIKSIGFMRGNILFFVGIVVIALIDALIPHTYLYKNICVDNKMEKKLYSAGFMIALGLALHNFPEGVAVFMSSYSNFSFGLVLALAITIHNIPEGLAIAAPIYHATKSKLTALRYTFIAGIMEPIGGFVSFILLRPFMTDNLLYSIFAVVAGIMVYISFDELLPVCLKHENKYVPIFGITLGMLIAALSLGLMY